MKLLLLIFTVFFTAHSQNKKHISRHIYSIYQKSSMDIAIDAYYSLKQNNSYIYNIDELNELGYHLLKQEKLNDAIQIFKLNTEEYPDEPNVFDSYAEASIIKQSTYSLAEQMYKKAIRLSDQSPDYTINLIKFYEKTNRINDAITLRLDMTHRFKTPELYDKMIFAYFRFNQSAKAISFFKSLPKKIAKYSFPYSRNLLKKEGIDIKQITDGWLIKDSDTIKNNLRDMETKIYSNVFKKINGIVISKNKSLVYENYFNDSHMFSLHDVRSVGKTYTNAALGLAINDGYISSENETVSSFYNLKDYKHYGSKKNDIELKHLLTMTSGIEGYDFDSNSIGNEENMYPQPNWVKWTLDLPMSKTRDPNEQWFYFTAGVVLLGDIIHKSVPNGLESYLHKKLFKPLQITKYKWQYTPQSVANTAGGIKMSTRDFAKFGQLYKNNGKWNNKQILSEEWVKKSLSYHTSTPIKNNSYGYLFWKKVYRVKNKDYAVTYASGNGGNKIFIFDNHDIIVAITASAYGQKYMHSQIDAMMTGHIIPSLGI